MRTSSIVVILLRHHDLRHDLHAYTSSQHIVVVRHRRRKYGKFFNNSVIVISLSVTIIQNLGKQKLALTELTELHRNKIPNAVLLEMTDISKPF